MHETSKEELNEKVEEFIATIDEGNLVKDEGTENIIGLQGYRLLPSGVPLDEFYLDELQYFSKSIIDAALKTHTNAKSKDFPAYWGWTAALSSHLETEEKFEEYRDILRDYYFLVHSSLISERHSNLIQENKQLHRLIGKVNPSVEGVTWGSGLPAAATYGFSVLEGLLKRRCSTLSTNQQIRIWEGLKELLHDPDISPTVKEVLTEIDDLERYDKEILARKLEGLPDLSDNNRLSWLLTKQRNYNIHGEGSTQAIGSIVLTLCSLVILDAISNISRPYEEIRSDVLERIQRSQDSPLIHSHSPAAFYPVKIPQ